MLYDCGKWCDVLNNSYEIAGNRYSVAAVGNIFVMNDVHSSRVDSIQKNCAPPAVPLLESLLNVITGCYAENYSNHVEYVSMYAFDEPASFFHTVRKLALSCEHNMSRSGSTVIETIMLGDACPEHCGELHIPSVVCEQWTLKYSVQKSALSCAKSKTNPLKEIEGFFDTAPLRFWLKEHQPSKRCKLTHRICEFSKAGVHLGSSFLLSTCQSSSSMLEDTCCSSADASVYPSKLVTEPPIEHDSVLIHSFSAIPIDSESVIDLYVRMPRRMPSGRPQCQLCLNNRSLDLSHLSAMDNSNDPDPLRIMRPVSSSTVNPLHHRELLSAESEIYRKLLDSPVVLMTGSVFRFPPLDANLVDNVRPMHTLVESGSSTLTKKSRSANTSESHQFSIESPPRKQPCFGQESDSQTVCQTANSKPSKPAPMEKVISEFNDLNVVNELITSAEENKKSVVPVYSKLNSDPSSFYLLESDTLSNDRRTSTDQGNNALDFQSGKVDKWLASIEYNLPVDGMVHRERRRNATSTCTPTDLRRDPLPLFHRRTGLPLQSSPVPLRRSISGRFDFDSSLCRLTPSESSTSICRRFSTLQPESESTSLLAKPEIDAKPANASSTRRRPKSLRLHKPPNTDEAEPQHSLRPQRRRTCPVETNHPELSCSAPPSGNRSSSFRSIPWLTNPLACTPTSFGSSQHLLVNFEESMLNGRIHPVGEVDGFMLELGASGSFVPAHVRLPLKAYFFDLSDDNKPSPYLGYTNLGHLRNGKGYHLPMKGSVQLTLFNPNNSVVKMFIISHDFEDMPPNSQTFLRQRTVYVPILDKQDVVHFDDSLGSQKDLHARNSLLPVPQDHATSSLSSCSCSSFSSLSSVQTSSSYTSNTDFQLPHNQPHLPHAAYLRYLVHLRFHTTRSGRLYLHTDLRLIFARNKFEFDPRVATYEPQSFTDAPSNPRYSPKKLGERSRNSVGFIPKVTTP